MAREGGDVENGGGGWGGHEMGVGGHEMDYHCCASCVGRQLSLSCSLSQLNKNYRLFPPSCCARAAFPQTRKTSADKMSMQNWASFTLTAFRTGHKEVYSSPVHCVLNPKQTVAYVCFGVLHVQPSSYFQVPFSLAPFVVCGLGHL